MYATFKALGYLKSLSWLMFCMSFKKHYLLQEQCISVSPIILRGNPLLARVKGPTYSLVYSGCSKPAWHSEDSVPPLLHSAGAHKIDTCYHSYSHNSLGMVTYMSCDDWTLVSAFSFLCCSRSCLSYTMKKCWCRLNHNHALCQHGTVTMRITKSL